MDINLIKKTLEAATVLWIILLVVIQSIIFLPTVVLYIDTASGYPIVDLRNSILSFFTAPLFAGIRS